MLAKAGRFLKRHINAVIFGATFAAFSNDRSASHTLPLGERILLGVSTFAAILLTDVGMDRWLGRKEDGFFFKNGFGVGKKRDIDLVKYTYRITEKLQKDYDGKGPLPPKVEAKVKGYISDAFGAASRIHLELFDGKENVFPFTHRVPDPDHPDRKKEIVIATLPAHPVPAPHGSHKTLRL